MSSVLIIDAELENVLATAILFHRPLLRRIRKHTALLLVVGRMRTAAHVRPLREGRRQRRLAPRNIIAHLYMLTAHLRALKLVALVVWSTIRKSTRTILH